jgi:uncharacterized tellurite resistance protein B-like protein
MFSAVATLFKELLEGQDLGTQQLRPDMAIACLLTEVAGADHDVSQSEQDARMRLLQKLCHLEQQEAENLLQQADQAVQVSASLYDFTSQLRSLSQEQRFKLIESMWQVADADGHIDPLEDAVIRKVAELLYVDHSEFIRAKLKVIDHC